MLENGTDKPATNVAFRIAFIYTLLGLLWASTSGTILGWYLRDEDTVKQMHSLIECLFILLTAAMLYHLINRHLRRLQRSEQSLRESEHRFFDLAAVGVSLVDPKSGRLVKVNSKFCEMTGYSAAELLEKRFQDITHPDDLEIDLKNTARLLAGEIKTFRREKRYLHRDGSVIWADLTVSPMWREGEERRYQIAVIANITERKLAENALRENQQLLAAIIDGANDAIFLKDLESRYILANPATLRIYGKTAEQMVGKTVADIHPDAKIAAAILENDRQILENGQAEVFEETVRIGSCYRTFISSKIPRRDAEGRVVGLIAVSHDISKRKEFEDQQRATIELLRLCNKAKNAKEFLRDLMLFFQGVTGCEAIGVRLQKNHDFPYYETRGFSEEFVLAESSLCEQDPVGQVIRDSFGNPVLACMCGNVLCGRYDASKPFFTARGSFWSNGTTALLASTSDADRQARTRNRCNGEGYESVALINISFQGETLGLVQFNDKRTGCFSAEKIAQWEDLVDYVAIALAKLKSDEALQRSEQSLLEAQEVASIGSFVYDVARDRWTGTAIMDHILGMEAGGATAWSELLHPDERDETLGYLKEVASRGCPFDREYRILRGDDRQERWVHTLGRLEYDADGEPVRLIGISQDITERKRADLEKVQLEAQLQQAQKMESIGRLAGGVAHDFNNMLSVILGHAQLAEMDLEPNAPLRDHLEEIRRAAESSATITGQLLAFARKQAIIPEMLDLNGRVGGILKMLQRLIGEDIKLNWRPGAGLWPVKVDPSQIDQILANLCVNSRDAIADIGTVTITTGNRTIDEAFCVLHPESLPGEYVSLEIGDNGCGMDQETAAHIFEPFFTTKGVGKGTGLGLATVYGAVRQNGGFISANSELGRGTTFTIYLPGHRGGVAGGREPDVPKTAPRGKETILLVEDETAILRMISMLLANQGYTVLAANNPLEGVSRAEEYPGEIDLLVTDVVMPGMNGLDLERRVKALRPKLKSLFLSGYTDDVIAHHGVLDEGVNFMHKPFSLPKLAVKVREVLDSE